MCVCVCVCVLGVFLHWNTNSADDGRHVGAQQLKHHLVFKRFEVCGGRVSEAPPPPPSVHTHESVIILMDSGIVPQRTIKPGQ